MYDSASEFPTANSNEPKKSYKQRMNNFVEQYQGN